jgi:hypothetical protein
MSNQINDQHHATEPSVAEMANMMDFGGGHSQTTGSQKRDQHDDDNAVFDVEAIEDEENDFFSEEFNPEKNITKVGLRKNGLAKGTLVAVTGLVAIVGGLTFFQGQVPKDKVAEVPKKKDAADEKVESAQSDATKAQQSESEIKAELALSKQKDALEQSNSNKTNDPNNSKTTDKPATDPNTKVTSSPAPSVPIVSPAPSANNPSANRQNSASGFVASPVVPPLAIPSNGSTKVAAASKNDTSIPPTGIQPLQTVGASKLAAASVGPFLNKNANSAPAALPNLSNTNSSIKAIAKAPGITNTPSAKAPVAEPVAATPKTIARVEPTRSKSSQESPIARKRSSEDNEDLPRLRIARAPGVAADTNTVNNAPPPPLYPVTPGINSLASQPPGSSIPSVAINSTPTLTDFLKTSAAADNPTPSIPPVSQPQMLAMNKDQSKDQTKEKQLIAKDPKSVLQIVPTPTKLALNKGNLIASGDTKGNKYSGLISPNSLLSDIVNPPPLGITIASTTPNIPVLDKMPLAVKPALTQGMAPGISGVRPAYAYTKMLLAGLPNTNLSLGNVEQVNNNNQQINQVSKSQVVTQNNPILNQPTTNPPEPNTSNTIPGTPVIPASPIGPLAASILTGTSAKGTTLTPILWGSDSANGAKFVAKLEEPLLASNKREALPAGTQLIVMAKPSNNSNTSNNNNSLVEVDVVGVIVQGREYATPPGAIVIHDENNGLLVGEDYFKREDQIASRDYMTVLGGALGTLGQVLNRPGGSFSSNTAFGSSSTTSVINNQSPNIFGALLEGGFKDIPGIWNQRNQQALAQLASQPKVYQIPKGRTVRVFVNQSINF